MLKINGYQVFVYSISTALSINKPALLSSVTVVGSHGCVGVPFSSALSGEVAGAAVGGGVEPISWSSEEPHNISLVASSISPYLEDEYRNTGYLGDILPCTIESSQPKMRRFEKLLNILGAYLVVLAEVGKSGC